MKVLVSIFNPAEFYPPTLNAVEYLAAKYDKVVLVTHAIPDNDRWSFSPNVEVRYVDQWPEKIHLSGALNNIRRFLNFTKHFRDTIRREQFDLVLLYEAYAVLAYKWTRALGTKKPPLLWYHNHDIFEPHTQGRLSIGRMAIKSEQAIFDEADIFTLPSNERKAYFPLKTFRGAYFFLPNYPSRTFYSRFYSAKLPGTELRIIFQGRIADGHGLEEIVALLNEKIQGKALSLHLKGIVSDEYATKLRNLANQHNVAGQLHFHGVTSYKEVPAVASTCDIGIAIHTKSDIMNKTLGTSSNKIYEYAAVGLPVLLYDNQHFRTHLGKYQWAVFTDCSADSLKDCLNNIVSNYGSMSAAAFSDFSNNLNFESQAAAVTDYIAEKNSRN